MFYYPHHIGDFIRDTSNLNDAQLAAYMRMIWMYYDTEKPLQLDCESIAFAVRSDEKTVHLLLRHFFTQETDGWHHKRCDEEIAKYHATSEKRRNSANARWKNANALHKQSKSNAKEPVFDANQEPITKNQDKPPTPKGVDERFSKFWSAYPSKVGKGSAEKAFQKIKVDDELLSAMLSAIEVQRQSLRWTKDGGQYIPNPTTWLNQRRWEDGSGSTEGPSRFAGVL